VSEWGCSGGGRGSSPDPRRQYDLTGIELNFLEPNRPNRREPI